MLKAQMTSPITGKMMPLLWEEREVEYRKEKYRVMVPFYRCEDSGEQFTTTESDGVWYRQMANQYCHKYGIPYVDEIIATRERYGLSAAAMSKILGFGPNQWRKYEQEEIPSVSNGRMIRSIMNPKVMLDVVVSAKDSLEAKEYERIVSRVKKIIAESEHYHIDQYEQSRVYATVRGEVNGYGPLSLVRLKNIMLYLLEYCQDVWCTKMNKLLFYVDFLSYRERGIAMTGLTYRAIDYGPVPERWERVYSQFDEIHQEPRTVGGYEGSVLCTTTSADMSMFNEEEIEILKHVSECFGTYSSRDLSEQSHQEKGWIDCHTKHDIIPYTDAFELRSI